MHLLHYPSLLPVKEPGYWDRFVICEKPETAIEVVSLLTGSRDITTLDCGEDQCLIVAPVLKRKLLFTPGVAGSRIGSLGVDVQPRMFILDKRSSQKPFVRTSPEVMQPWPERLTIRAMCDWLRYVGDFAQGLLASMEVAGQADNAQDLRCWPDLMAINSLTMSTGFDINGNVVMTLGCADPHHPFGTLPLIEMCIAGTLQQSEVLFAQLYKDLASLSENGDLSAAYLYGRVHAELPSMMVND